MYCTYIVCSQHIGAPVYSATGGSSGVLIDMCVSCLLLKESRHDKDKPDKKEKRDSSGGKEEKKQYP